MIIPPAIVFADKFGSWKNALCQAGLEYYELPPKPTKEYKKSRLSNVYYYNKKYRLKNFIQKYNKSKLSDGLTPSKRYEKLLIKIRYRLLEINSQSEDDYNQNREFLPSSYMLNRLFNLSWNQVLSKIEDIDDVTSN